MWKRLIVFALLLYLLFNLPFFTIGRYKKRVYLFKNEASEHFVKSHPDIKDFIYFTHSTKHHPLFLVINDIKDSLIKKSDFVYLTKKEDNTSIINSIPTHAFIGDTIKYRTLTGKDTFKVIRQRNNFIKIGGYSILIKGIWKNVYVVDTIYSFEPYIGALRRYFEQKPFFTFVSINPNTHRVYLKEKVIKNYIKLNPIVYTIGKNLILLKENPIKNPNGFYLALEDTTLSVPIKEVSNTKIEPDTTFAYLIGYRKYPLFFIKNGRGFIASTQIDIIARTYPDIFNKLMDQILKFSAKPIVIGYPQEHVYKIHEPVNIHILNIPSTGICFAERRTSKDPIIFSNSITTTYTFIPQSQDTQIIIDCKGVKDTVKINLINNMKNIVTCEKKFISKIHQNTYNIKRPIIGKSRESNIFYFLLLLSLIGLWTLEKRKI